MNTTNTIKYHFTAGQLGDFEGNIHREWALTNGIGGYAGSSVIGAHNRTHQGYLIASLHPPVNRFLVFSKTNESFTIADAHYDLETSQHKGTNGSEPSVYARGNRYLTDFIYDGTVSFRYAVGDLVMTKSLALVQGENTVALSYHIENSGPDATFVVTPLMNYREHSASSTPETLRFEVTAGEHGFRLIPKADPACRICLFSDSGELVQRETLFDIDMQLQTEVDNEVDGLDCHFTPYDLTYRIPAKANVDISILCTVQTGTDDTAAALSPQKYEAPSPHTAGDLIQKQRDFLSALIEKAGYGDDDFANTLVLAANQFLALRQSTGLMTVLAGLPWFTDWGRDTMIAFTGLTLCTGRYEEARQILQTFARYVHHGMVPNMFPDNGQEPLYNTVDASLWYFYAVHQYLRYVDTKDAYDFIQTEIYPCLKEIIAAYKSGTDFSIYMEEDGLIHAGSGLDQVTWMDVRVGEWVVTPRHGKPVEINALWYNALCIMSELSEHFGEDPQPYRTLSEQVRASFCEKFWYEDGGYLYDVIDGDLCDASLRPNQIYAVSLPYTMLPADKEKAVVDTVARELYASYGLRSLAPSHPDYHPIYLGALAKRDAAYHQGTAWGFLMGGFISAYIHVYGHERAAIAEACAFLAPIRAHFYEGCIGSVSEIFDGDKPHTCRGCYAQAWSVGEILRCYSEDILPYI